MEKRKELTREQQWEYAKSTSYQMKVYLAGFSNILPEVVDFLVDSNQFWIAYQTVIQNKELSPTTLAKAAKKIKSESLLVAIGYHLCTDAETLEYLAKLGDYCVTSAVAANPNTKKELLDELADSDNIYIQRAVLLNPNTKKETRKKIRSKNKKWVFLFARSWYDIHKIKVRASGN